MDGTGQAPVLSCVAPEAGAGLAAGQRILFVDDHPLYREGVERAVANRMPGVEVLVAGDAVQAMDRLRSDADVDLCLVDYRLGEGDGLSLLACIARDFPAVARGLVSSALSPELVRRAQAIGCTACLSKSRDIDGIHDALTTMFSGGTVFDVPAGGSHERALTERRRDVLRYAAAGSTNKEIARLLGIAERSVKDHWVHIFEQLGVTTRAEAVGAAYRRNLI